MEFTEDEKRLIKDALERYRMRYCLLEWEKRSLESILEKLREE